MSTYKAPKGTKDVLPDESYQWQYLEGLIRKITAKYGYQEARTPVFEHTELFLRGVGSTTDIVQKEMYTFKDKGDRSVTLKPEGTAGMVRMFIESGLCAGTQPTKVYYLYSPVFRYERPQAGRLREHHQFGAECFGSQSPTVDAELIAMAMELLTRVGCTELTVKLNSIGCPKCRAEYHKALHAYLEERRGELCETCRERLDVNPLRILDCKEERCQEICRNAPMIPDYLCEECREHMRQLQGLLDDIGIRYVMSPTLVRGLDYYTKTVFEIVTDKIGAQGTVCGGGRYDGLIQEIGGPAMPAAGFGLGMERLLLLMQNSGIGIPKPSRIDLYLAASGEEARRKAFVLTGELRKAGIRAETDHMDRSFKAQYKYADKIGARYVLAVGDSELAAGTAKVRRMEDGTETETALSAEALGRIVKG